MKNENINSPKNIVRISLLTLGLSIIGSISIAQNRREERNGNGGNRTYQERVAVVRSEQTQRQQMPERQNNTNMNRSEQIHTDRGNVAQQNHNDFNRQFQNNVGNRNDDYANAHQERHRNDRFDRDRNDQHNRNFGQGNWSQNRMPHDINTQRGGYNNYHPYYQPINNWPTYNAYNPCWRYSNLPRLNSVFAINSGFINLSFGGYGYRYYDGIYYRNNNNIFNVCMPPVGIFINVLPRGYTTTYLNNYPYYYFNGTYYDYRNNNYYVVSPPVGAVVESLPIGYQTISINGETYYMVNGAQYKPFVEDNGEIWYQVIKAN